MLKDKPLALSDTGEQVINKNSNFQNLSCDLPKREKPVSTESHDWAPLGSGLFEEPSQSRAETSQ